MGRRYHLSPRTNTVLPCSTDNCPFGTAPHFDSTAEAEEYFKQMDEAKTQGPSFNIGEMKVDYLPMGMKQNSNTMAVPAGIYVMCDPRQILADDNRAWNQWTGAANQQSGDRAVGASINGYPIVAINVGTDGVFNDSLDRTIATETGYIALVPVEFAQKKGFTLDDLANEGPLVNFDETSLVRWTDKGMAVGQYLTIPTDANVPVLTGEKDEYYYKLEQEFPTIYDDEDYPDEYRDDISLSREERRRRAVSRSVYDMNRI